VVSHETESGDARNRVVIDSETQPAPIFCRHCDRPECALTCMTGAMQKDLESGYVTYDKEQCASCYMCIMACPYGILKYDPIHKKEIMKCNMCVHRSEDGVTPKPMCVEKCPMHAITLEEVK
jgi:carbon-monoxide dehydrogenase iron sulfur subunit